MANSVVILGRIATTVALGLFVSGCPRAADEPAPPAQPIDSQPPATSSGPQLPAGPATALTRADVIEAARAAAAAYAAGAVPEGNDTLVGRSFSVALPVGCAGPAAGLPAEAADGLARVAWNADRTVIRFSLTPGDWTTSALIAGANGSWEEVEGIWLPRPWMTEEGCPAVRADPLQNGPQTGTAQSLGLAVVHDEEGSRLDRRNGRAYAHTLRGEGTAPAQWPQEGLRVRLEGRIVGFPDSRAFRCRAGGPDSQPVCVAAVQLDRLALEGPTGEALSEWRGG
ncbi:MAG: hypothetical protein J0L52_12795 [Caulobacterales bacterium]|nr:hypothetical protein [Caulobacterales bacterium]